MSEEKEEKIKTPNENILQTPLIENKEENHNNENDNNQQEQRESRLEENNKCNLSNKQLESIKSISFVVNHNIRWFLFFLFVIINLLMNFDHGTIPAATEQIRNFIDLTNSELGLFGSFVFIGVIIGSLISMTIINTFNRKYILMICLILCGISLFIFTITKNYTLLCIDRVVIGSFQAFISIYLPLWCDQFGFEKRKTMMMALIQVAPPLGVLVGYFVTTLLTAYLSNWPIIGAIDINQRWLYSFYIQSFIIWGISICLLFFSDKYFNSKARRVPSNIEETLNFIQKKNTGVNRHLSFFYEGNENFDDLQDSYSSEKDIYEDENEEEEDDNNVPKEEMKEIKEDNKNTNEKKNNNNKKNIKNKDNNKKSNNKSNKKSNINEELSFCTKLKLIFSEPLFICCVLILSILFFIVTCVQYWTSDYMLIALDLKDEMQRLYGFAIVCLTSPTCGLLLGGYIVDKIGGYSKKGALIFCFVVSILCIIPGIPLPLVDSAILYALFLWLLLFGGASTLPTMTGLAISCLPKSVQGSGNSFVIFFYNLLGYLPAPFVYGFLKDLFHDKNDPKKGSRVAQRATIWVTFSVCFIIGIAIIFRFKNDKEYTEKMGRNIANKSENHTYDNNNDIAPYAIRPRESSLKPEVNENKEITIYDGYDNSMKINVKENNDDTNNKSCDDN